VGGATLTVLSTSAVKSRLAEQDLGRRIVISPLLDPAAQAKEGQASVDVRLGFDFCLVSPSAHGSVNEFESGIGSQGKFEALYQSVYVPFGSHIVIHPHQFILAQTLEYIRLPSDVMAYVVGRSTWGRLGLIVATAVGIHPNFAGSLTLELRNLGETPLTLHPGQTIAQLFFHTVINESGLPSNQVAPHAQYAGSVDMVPRLLSSTKTYAKLNSLIERFDRLTKV
jgi:dCTP deaminase